MLDLKPAVSHFQVCVSALAYALGFISLWFSDVPTPLQWAVSFALAVAAVWQWRLLTGRHADAVTRIIYSDGWWITLGSGAQRKVRCSRPLILPWVVSAQLDDGSKCYSLVIYADQVSKTEHRKLRALLSMMPAKSSTNYLKRCYLAIAGWYENRVSRAGR